MNARLSDFDYPLPQDLIAQYPVSRRDASRLLLINRKDSSIQHRFFRDIVDYFRRGDTLVLNNTRVIPARLIGKLPTGGKVELFFLNRLSSKKFQALARPAKKLPPGRKIIFKNGKYQARVIADSDTGKIVELNGRASLAGVLNVVGAVPLPPYIKRKPAKSDWQRYQTVYARHRGATASPTAGLHFTPPLLKKIEQIGVNLVYVTLHVSYGTFAPVRVGDFARHKMHREYFSLSKDSAEIINHTKKSGKKIFAVGTTTTRVCESCAQGSGKVKAQKGYTSLFIFPPYKFKVVDHLITNFHLPKSTLLLLVSAFAGKNLIFRAYRAAIKNRYRFFSYGDATLIL